VISPFGALSLVDGLADFQISNSFLIKTYDNAVVPTDIFTFQPLDLGVDAEHITQQLTWVYLVEPQHASSAVLKFSGTLGM
jgi:hypothetical protein